jgi:hypothetical protein
MANKPYPPSGSRTPEAKARREAHWREVLERWRRSGLSKTEFSSREGISRDVLGWWQVEIARRELARQSRIPVVPLKRDDAALSRPAFIPVRVTEPPSSPTSTPLDLVVGDRIVRVRPGFDVQTLSRLLAILEGDAC